MAGARVLVVEDVRHMAHFLKRSLERAGYEVHAVHHGDEVLPAIATFSPRALILDLVLPGKSGLEICRALKGDPRHRDLKVLIVTGHSFDDASAEEIRDAGADCQFTKPVSPVSLRAKLIELGVHGDGTEAPPAEPEAAAKGAGNPLGAEVVS
jgi:DNA-binding response OmpR family regulator